MRLFFLFTLCLLLSACTVHIKLDVDGDAVETPEYEPLQEEFLPLEDK